MSGTKVFVDNYTAAVSVSEQHTLVTGLCKVRFESCERGVEVLLWSVLVVHDDNESLVPLTFEKVLEVVP